MTTNIKKIVLLIWSNNEQTKIFQAFFYLNHKRKTEKKNLIFKLGRPTEAIRPNEGQSRGELRRLEFRRRRALQRRGEHPRAQRDRVNPHGHKMT
jgi:hypothetical protein